MVKSPNLPEAKRSSCGGGGVCPAFEVLPGFGALSLFGIGALSSSEILSGFLEVAVQLC